MAAGKGTRLVDRDGIWYVVWTGNSRGVTTGTRSRPEAERFLATFITERESGGGGPARGLTCRQALDDYEREHVMVKVVDRARFDDMKAHLVAYFGETVIVELEPDDFTGYVESRAGGNGGTKKPRKAKAPTSRKELGVLTAAFNHEVKQRRLKREHVPYIDLPQSSVPRDHWLYEDECDLLLRCCLPGDDGTWQEAMAGIKEEERLPRIFGFVAIALETAARRRSIEKLTRFQVKDGKINFAPVGHRQTKKRRPTVPVSDRLRPVLERLLKQNADSPHVLGTPGSVRTPFQTAVARAAKALQAAGKEDRAKAMRRTIPHTLRHTWATLAVMGGVPLWEVAGVLGDTIATVTKNYAHHSPDHLRGAVNFRTPETTGKEEKA